jgi:hypothetical protein
LPVETVILVEFIGRPAAPLGHELNTLIHVTRLASVPTFVVGVSVTVLALEEASTSAKEADVRGGSIREQTVLTEDGASRNGGNTSSRIVDSESLWRSMWRWRLKSSGLR